MACKHFKISRVFLRFFLSFFSVLIIPLFVLGTISGKTIQNIMRKNESERTITALSRCAEGIDDELNNISTIVFKASSEQEFSPYMMGDFIQSSRSVMEHLKRYKTANNFIQEIYLFSPYSDYIFSTGTTYSYERFITQKLPDKLPGTGLSDYLSQTAAASRYGYMPSSDEHTFFLVFSLPSFQLTHYAYMIFEIPKKALLSHFKIVTGTNDSNLMVFDNGLLIASFADHPEEMQRIIKKLSDPSYKPETGYIAMEDTRIPLFFLADENSGLSYILSIPETGAMAEISQVIRLFTFYLMITALLGTLGIYLLTKLNYSPIKKLAKSTDGLFGNTMSNHRIDEIDHLHGYVKSSQSTYRNMHLELQDFFLAAKYFFIKNVVNAYPYSPDELYFQNHIDQACFSIKTGDKQLLFQTMETLFKSIRSETYSMYVARLLCYDVTNHIIKTLKEMAENSAGFELPDLIALTSFENADELEQMLCQYGEAACDFVNSRKPPSLSDMAINLVSQNYALPSFSVGSISEALGVSSSYLSHTFKEQQSITLHDYIKLYKIGLAKQMLVETDDSLEKIIRLLGYYDCSSFIRMFKKSEGITPGEYRKKST